MQRFVILYHQKFFSEESHWDVMLEVGDVLRTWSLVPLTKTSFSVPAKRLPDHRLAYLDYEGEISGGRGTVKRVDTGTYTMTDENTFHLDGEIFRGTLTLPEQEGTATYIREPQA